MLTLPGFSTRKGAAGLPEGFVSSSREAHGHAWRKDAVPAPAALRAKVEGRAYCVSPVLQDLCALQLSSNELFSLLGIKSELALVCHSPCRANSDLFPHHTGLLCFKNRRAPWVLLFLGNKGNCQPPSRHPQYWELPPAPLQKHKGIPCLHSKSEMPLLLHRCCFSSAPLQNEQWWEGCSVRPWSRWQQILTQPHKGSTLCTVPLSLKNWLLIPGQILSGWGKESSPELLALYHAPARDGSKDIIVLAGDSNTHQQD